MQYLSLTVVYNIVMLRKKLFLILAIFIIYASCNKELKTTFSDITISTDNNTLVEVNITKADGNNSIADNINSEIQKLVIATLHIGNPNNITSKSIEESIDVFNKEYTDFTVDFPDTVPKWEAQIDGEVIFQSHEIISLALTSYVFTGGAHGSLHISFKNFNAQTGHLLNNDALFSDVKGFKTLAKTYFDKAIKDKNTLFEPTKFQLPENICYGEEGVVLLYNTYEIAPYSTGIIEFEIPFEVAKPFLVFNSL